MVTVILLPVGAERTNKLLQSSLEINVSQFIELPHLSTQLYEQEYLSRRRPEHDTSVGTDPPTIHFPNNCVIVNKVITT